MPDNRGSFIQEAVSAGRGVLALIVGDRKASNYFDLSQTGLVGSFIGLLGALALNLAVALALGSAQPGEITRAVFSTALLYGALAAAAALLLRAIGRSDALTPYLTASNWANVTFGLVLLVFTFIDLGPLVYAVFVAGFIVSINIARLIMTLKPSQIAMLIVAQVITVGVAVLVSLMIFPLSPEQLAELAAASNPPS